MKFNLFKYLRCVFGNGHLWKNSRTRPGYRTCEHCGVRRRY
jgi:hypothetical protein